MERNGDNLSMTLSELRDLCAKAHRYGFEEGYMTAVADVQSEMDSILLMNDAEYMAGCGRCLGNLKRNQDMHLNSCELPKFSWFTDSEILKD